MLWLKGLLQMSLRKVIGQLCSDWIPLSDHSVKPHCYEWQCRVHLKGQALHEASGPGTEY